MISFANSTLRAGGQSLVVLGVNAMLDTSVVHQHFKPHVHAWLQLDGRAASSHLASKTGPVAPWPSSLPSASSSGRNSRASSTTQREYLQVSDVTLRGDSLVLAELLLSCDAAEGHGDLLATPSGRNAGFCGGGSLATVFPLHMMEYIAASTGGTRPVKCRASEHRSLSSGSRLTTLQQPSKRYC